MATKTITTTVTLHAPGAKHEPFKFDAAGSRIGGFYDVEHHPPGSEITLDAKEADAILKRFGGEVVNADGSKKAVDAEVQAPPKLTTEVKPVVAAKTA